MLTVLFWNVGGLDRAQVCARLAHRHQATILSLAECSRPLSVLRALNPQGSPARYYFHRPQTCRVATFSTLGQSCLPTVEETRHYSIRRLVRAPAPELLLASAHFKRS